MSSFHERQKSLFNHLKNAEDQCGFSKSNETGEQDYGIIDRHSYRRLKHEMKQFRGKESIFKKPQASIQNCLKYRNTPAHIKNPKKWSYYTLSDVTPDQMSDASNVATARAFLKKMEDQKSAHIQMEEDIEDGTVFKRPKFRASSSIKVKTSVDNGNDNNKPFYKDRKLIMPEYVVGQSKTSVRKNKPVRKQEQESLSSVRKVELKLNHLYDEEIQDD